ncbi:MAG: hypothetical protein MUD14_28590, partial [Hydrococcus sp. Prado102]|nr:hypothetical protein [Hydrococcus sp. Prado102]
SLYLNITLQAIARTVRLGKKYLAFLNYLTAISQAIAAQMAHFLIRLLSFVIMIHYCLTKLTSFYPSAILIDDKQIKFIAPFKQESKE